MLTKAMDHRSRWFVFHVPLLVMSTLFGFLGTAAAQNAGHRQTVTTGRPKAFTGGMSQSGRTLGVYNSSETTSTHHVTVVGAVQRSGVYETDQRQVRVSSLIDAAGGLTDASTGSLRIIRDGRPRLQMTFRPENHDTIFSGDIVVATGRPVGHSQSGDSGVIRNQSPANQSLIPIVCIGVIDRPVVLPLASQHANLNMLARLLGQAPEVMSAVRVWSAGRPLNSESLLAGDVLDFSKAPLDAAAISRLEAFPPTLPLSAPESATPQVDASVSLGAELPEPATMPTELAQPQAPVIVHRPLDAPREANPSQVPASNGLTAPTSNEPGVTVAAAPPIMAAPELPIATSFAAEDVEPIESTVAEPTPSLPVEVGKPLSSSDTLIDHDDALPAVTSVPTGLPTAESVDVISAETAIPEEPIQTEPTPSRAALPTEHLFDAEAVSPLDGQQASTEAAQPNVLWPLVIGLAVVLVMLIAGTAIWSNYMPIEVPAQEQLLTQDRQGGSATGEGASPAAISDEAQSVSSGGETSDSVMDSIVREVADLVEEPAELPSGFQYHGDPVGHRRIAIHDRHEELRGPHFVPQQQPGPQSEESIQTQTTSTAERRLRQMFRHDASHGASGRSPSATTAGDEVRTEDSVGGSVGKRPQATRRPRSSITAESATASPLERALRYLENEAHS